MDLLFRASGDNYGGVDRFWFIHEEAISHVDFYGRIIPKPGFFWHLAKSVKYTTELSIVAAPARSGVIYEVDLRGKLKKYRPDLEAVLEAMRGERYAVIIKDLNGYLYQIGRPDELLTFRTDQGTDAVPSGNNEYRFRFSGDTKYKPLPWFGIIPVGPDTPQDPVIGSAVRFITNGTQAGDVEPGGTIHITTDVTSEMLFSRSITPPETTAPIGAVPVQVFFNQVQIEIVPAGSTYSVTSEFSFQYQITQP